MNDTFLVFIIAFCLIILVFSLSSNTRQKNKVFKNNTYQYTARHLPMTETEADFFMKLEIAVGERYYIFPQVHLSSILDHRVSGQDWRFAFRHINGKSVDFLLCDKSTLKPTYAIELDDYTHERKDRIKRDIEVERIFQAAGIPLVRLKDKDGNRDAIIESLIQARSRLS